MKVSQIKTLIKECIYNLLKCKIFCIQTCRKQVFFVIVRLLVTVVRTVQQSKTVRFLHVAFETTGDSFLAGDHHGNIYVFDIGRNRCDCGQNNKGLLARPDLLLSHLI